MGFEALWSTVIGAVYTFTGALLAWWALKLSGAAMTSLGPVWAILGAISVVVLGGLGSAIGVRISGTQAAGILSEKPELFGKMLVLMALPGTQGFYSFVCAIVIVSRAGFLAGAPTISNPQGLALFVVGTMVGIVEWLSAILQGQSSAASESLVGRQPASSGQAILIPALVETYAVLSLVTGILLSLWITGAKF